MIIQQQAHTAHCETSQNIRHRYIYIILFALWVVYRGNYPSRASQRDLFLIRVGPLILFLPGPYNQIVSWGEVSIPGTTLIRYFHKPISTGVNLPSTLHFFQFVYPTDHSLIIMSLFLALVIASWALPFPKCSFPPALSSTVQENRYFITFGHSTTI